MSSRTHIVITGTGRSGTTFLIELLTQLGLETGFNASDIDIVSKKNTIARAGLEYDIRLPDCPFIVKSPWFCDHADEVIARDDVVIQHVFIPIRDLNAAAESRRHVARENISNLSLIKRLKYLINPREFDGGLVRTKSKSPGVQEGILLKKIYNLMLALSDNSLPMTFMRYPRIVKDCPYLFEKLKPALGDISYADFSKAFNKTVRPELVHSFNDKDI